MRKQIYIVEEGKNERPSKIGKCKQDFDANGQDDSMIPSI